MHCMNDLIVLSHPKQISERCVIENGKTFRSQPVFKCQISKFKVLNMKNIIKGHSLTKGTNYAVLKVKTLGIAQFF